MKVAMFAAVAAVLVGLAGGASAGSVLFRNVRVFDGHGTGLSEPTNVLVRNNVIESIAPGPVEARDAAVIEGQGMTLMPGLIDAHWHVMLARPTAEQAIMGDVGFISILASVEAKATLMRGFTTVRDMGGPSFGLKAAIDAGLVPGPRIFPSGAMITTTGGHGDFRFGWELPRTDDKVSRAEAISGSAIADGRDEVLRRVREQLLLGASQIKLTAGGGVASPHSPIDVATFTEDELRAAVEAAGSWGTYVTVHAYTPEAIRRAVAAGVQCIEHAHLMDEATAQLMAEKGVWLSTQPFEADSESGDAMSADSQAKKAKVVEGTDLVYRLARKYGIKTAFGTDILFSTSAAAGQATWIPRMTQWYSPAETLGMATGTNGELLALSGPRAPYAGRLGVVEPGALADLLLVDGDPVADIGLMADPDRSLRIIMKDGTIYKNSL